MRDREVGELSREASELSAQLEGSLEGARREVQRALARLAALATTLEPGEVQARRMSEVGESSGQAATRTDLLALNFQVAAARLGEDDRGLERVAYEIRSLADRGARGAAEVQEIANSLQRNASTVRDAYEASRESLKEARTAVDEALRRCAKVGEVLSLAQVAAQSSRPPSRPSGGNAEAVEERREAVDSFASAVQGRDDTITRLAQVSAARLWQSMIDLRAEGGRAADSADLLRRFDQRLRELFGLVSNADEIARRAKQLALNADLAANRSEDPAFSVFAEEAHRLSEQAEITASTTETQLTEAQALIAPELLDREERAHVLARLAKELERVLRGFGSTGEHVADQAELEQLWRENQASARNLSQARASLQAFEEREASPDA